MFIKVMDLTGSEKGEKKNVFMDSSHVQPNPSGESWRNPAICDVMRLYLAIHIY